MTTKTFLPDAVRERVAASRRRWAVTRAVSFVGSPIVDALVRNGQDVVATDSFATGKPEYLDAVARHRSPEQREAYRFSFGYIRDRDDIATHLRRADNVLHQAANGSAPRSIADPLKTFDAHVSGYFDKVLAARDASTKRVVYASSSSVNSEDMATQWREASFLRPLSPYAALKVSIELLEGTFVRIHDMSVDGQTYLSMFGPCQDPNGPNATFVTCWLAQLNEFARPTVNGDGETCCEYWHIDNVEKANLAAALSAAPSQPAYNVAFSRGTSLPELFELLCGGVAASRSHASLLEPNSAGANGDIRTSVADIMAARRDLGYGPAVPFGEGQRLAIAWYMDALASDAREQKGTGRDGRRSAGMKRQTLRVGRGRRSSAHVRDPFAAPIDPVPANRTPECAE